MKRRQRAIFSIQVLYFLALAGFGALGFAEYNYKEEWKDLEHGWSNLVAWIGVTGQLMGSFLSMILSCVLPYERSGKNDRSVHYVGKPNPAYQGDNTRENPTCL